MALIPVVESPCPIAGKQLPAGATEHCSLCERSVHNLDRMSARERGAFMSACSGKVCVAYTVRIPVRQRGLALATLAAAALVSLPVAAEGPDSMGPAEAGADTSPVDPSQLPHCDEFLDYVIVGGVSHGDQAEWTDDGKDAPPELPTMEDDGR
jgi:hypothetical protein